MARKPSKTVVQRDQYEMSFARRMWAQDADLNHIGLLAVTIAVGGFGALFAAEDFLLLPALGILLLLGFSVLVSSIYSMRWTDRKGILVGVHLVTIIGTFALLVHGSLARNMIAEQRASESAAATKAAEAARNTDEECNKARAAAIEIATRRKADAYAALKRCRVNFESNWTIFTMTTVRTHCKARRVGLALADKDLEVANALPCAPTATGSIVSPRAPTKGP